MDADLLVVALGHANCIDQVGQPLPLTSVTYSLQVVLTYHPWGQLANVWSRKSVPESLGPFHELLQ